MTRYRRRRRRWGAAHNTADELQTDVIDLFYQHRVDPNVPFEDVAGTGGELVQAGTTSTKNSSATSLAPLRDRVVIANFRPGRGTHPSWWRAEAQRGIPKPVGDQAVDCTTAVHATTAISSIRLALKDQ